MRIAFLTDLHLANEQERPLGVNARQNLLDALAILPELKPDFVIIGGDICYQTGEEPLYRWFNEQIAPIPYPYFIIAGNHDDPTMMARCLGLGNDLHDDEIYFARQLGDQPVLFLDTVKGYCSENQWVWLDQQITQLTTDSLLLVMHHPPVLAGVGHMDTNYPFQQSDRLLQRLAGLRRVTVLCGHYHVEKVVQQANVTALLTPSLFFQMKHDPIECIPIDFHIAVRELNLTPDGFTSALHYLEGNKS